MDQTFFSELGPEILRDGDGHPLDALLELCGRTEATNHCAIPAHTMSAGMSGLINVGKYQSCMAYKLLTVFLFSGSCSETTEFRGSEGKFSTAGSRHANAGIERRRVDHPHAHSLRSLHLVKHTRAWLAEPGRHNYLHGFNPLGPQIVT